MKTHVDYRNQSNFLLKLLHSDKKLHENISKKFLNYYDSKIEAIFESEEYYELYTIGGTGVSIGGTYNVVSVNKTSLHKFIENLYNSMSKVERSLSGICDYLKHI